MICDTIPNILRKILERGIEGEWKVREAAVATGKEGIKRRTERRTAAAVTRFSSIKTKCVRIAFVINIASTWIVND